MFIYWMHLRVRLVGLGWVWQLFMGWVGLGQRRSTHVHLCIDYLRFYDVTPCLL